MCSLPRPPSARLGPESSDALCGTRPRSRPNTGRVRIASIVLPTFEWTESREALYRQVDDDALVADLHRTATDDLLLGEHLTVDRAGDRSLATVVPVESSLGGFLDRAVRHVLSFRFFESGSQWASVLIGVGQALALAVAPLPATGLMLLGALGVYAAPGARRWTAVFAAFSLLLNALVTLYTLANPEFEWSGRTYRWADMFDVEIRR